MATTTTRLGYRRVATTDPISVETDFGDNWGVSEAHPGMRVCTSFSRPQWGGPHVGMLAYETDTKAHTSWDGDTFLRLASSGGTTQQFIRPNTGGWPLIALTRDRAVTLLSLSVQATPGSLLKLRAMGGWLSYSGATALPSNASGARFSFSVSTGPDTPPSLFRIGNSVALSALIQAPESSAASVSIAVSLTASALHDSVLLWARGPESGVSNIPTLSVSVEEV